MPRLFCLELLESLLNHRAQQLFATPAMVVLLQSKVWGAAGHLKLHSRCVWLALHCVCCCTAHLLLHYIVKWYPFSTCLADAR